MKQVIKLLVVALMGSCTSTDQPSDAYGNFESEEVLISSETAGRILSLSVDEGQTIKEGDLLAMIDTTQLYLQKGQLLASMDALYDNLQDIPVQLQVFMEQEDILQREITRVRNLLEKGAATQKQLDDLSGELDMINQRRDALESQLSTANRAILSQIKPMRWKVRQLEDLIQRSQVIAPMDGTVLQKYKHQGEVTGMGQPLVKVADLQQMVLRAFISGDQLSTIKLGDEVTVLIDDKGQEMRTYPGTVTWISQKSEFTPKTIQTKTERVNLVYGIKVAVPNDGTLKIGMPAEVNFLEDGSGN